MGMPNAETVREFVIAGHGDLDKVKAMLSEQPDLRDAAQGSVRTPRRPLISRTAGREF